MDQTEKYLEDLKNEDPSVRESATRALWILWHTQFGAELEKELNDGTELMDNQQPNQALEAFQSLIEKCPEFVEAHNKLATLLFMMGRFEESVKECEEVLRRIPHHFGALNGMGLCLFDLRRYEEAIKYFQKALEIQPYAVNNHSYIARCRGNLN
jgi:tetratricopeptide (TPR) repeat protein